MSALAICNRALTRIGAGRIFSFEDNTETARLCKDLYDPVRRELLRSHPWNFARRRRVLSRLEEAPAFGWSYQYALPADCLRLANLNGVEVGLYSEEFQIETTDDDQLVLLCNSESASVIYITDIEDSSKFDSLFSKALAIALAIELATRIKDSSTLVNQLQVEFERVTAPMAKAANAREVRGRKANVTVPWESRIIIERFGGRYGSRGIAPGAGDSPGGGHFDPTTLGSLAWLDLILASHVNSGTAADGHVLTANGVGGATWGEVAGGTTDFNIDGGNAASVFTPIPAVDGGGAS